MASSSSGPTLKSLDDAVSEASYSGNIEALKRKASSLRKVAVYYRDPSRFLGIVKYPPNDKIEFRTKLHELWSILTLQEPEIPPPIAKFGIWPHFRIEYQGLGVGDDFETLGLALSWRELALETYRIVVEVDHGCPKEILDWVGLHPTKELEKVTDGFKEELGRGAFRTVSKGVIGNDKKVVAVKRLDIKLLAEREREFSNRDESYWENTSQEPSPSTQMYYSLLKNNLVGMKEWKLLATCAKISDFGLAKLLNPDQTKTFTDIRGTRGYVAPEWHRKSPVTVKVDVYSFGVVLLEIICCRKNVDYNLSEEEAILEEWACHCFETGESDKLVNDEDVDKGQLERMIKVAIWCIQDEPSIRPSMKKVLLMLEGTVEILIPPSLTIVTTM
uniref:Protein kinase domain-containing protein n=1 Tax=Fagus sylvatica TaxID=28930 RepID=A0A2N9IK67_FAGSY